MTKRERTKLWIKRNQDLIILSGIGIAVVGLAIVGVKADMAYRDRLSSQMNDYIDQLNSTVGELESLEVA